MRPRLRASLFSGGARARDPCALERKEVEFVAPPEEPLELRCLLAARGRRLLLGLGLRRLLLGGRPLGDEADVVPHPILLVLAVVFFLGFGTSARAALIEQMLHREQIIARSGANSIETFMNLVGNSITIIAKGTPTPEDLDVFTEKWNDTPVVGIILTDASGEVIVNSNRTGELGTGVNLSDRDYFIWAKTAAEGQVYVSAPVISRLGTSKGKFIVLISSPVVENGEFKGVLAGAALLSDVPGYFLEPLKISPATRIYLLDDSGVILSSGVPQLIGVNYIDYLASNPFLGSVATVPTFKKALASKEEGKIDIALQDETNQKLTRYLIAYTPLLLNGDERHWLLAVATPAEDALVYMGPIYARQFVAIIVAFLAVLALGIRLAKVIAYREARQKLQK